MTAASTLAPLLDGVARWVEGAIAPQLAYYVPPGDGAVGGEEPARVHPSVFQQFVPSAERLPEASSQSPSIIVQLLGVKDAKGVRTADVRLLLSIWSPGRWEDGAFARDPDGWRELYNGLGAIAAAVERAETIAGSAIDANAGVKFGYLAADREIPDLYPYWVGRVDFTLVRAPHANDRFDNLL